jgi:hypothetical protein
MRWYRQLLYDFADNFGPGGLGQLCQFLYRIRGRLPEPAPLMSYGQ